MRRRSHLLARRDPRQPTGRLARASGELDRAFAENRPMSQDILSDVLRSVRLRGAVFFFLTGGSRWVAEAPASSDIASAVMPEAEHVMEYHVITAGDCWAAVVGTSPVRLTAGDVIVLPHGDAHVMSSAPGMRADPRVSWYYELKLNQKPLRVAYDGLAPPDTSARVDVHTSEATTMVCGFLGCDLRPFNPLVATLPRLMHLRADDGGAWVAQFMRQAVAESSDKRPGSEAMLERMSEMMFVDAVRRHVERLPEGSTGWLAGLRDRFVGRALALLHEQPARAWTLDELGNQVGLSRSALHERFVQMIGQPPVQYLTQWRMQLAARRLRESQQPVAAIALDVGYESEAAFARAFKRSVGLPPAAWRRSQALRQALPAA
jgi:AraC-like DNA-binding protein